MTVQELANRVLDDRKKAWAKSEPQTAILATEQLNPDDEQAVRRIVAEAGYEGAALEDMARQVSSRVVGKVEALAYKLPAQGGD
jgi:protein-L-isoaspartate O-methyltransferase